MSRRKDPQTLKSVVAVVLATLCIAVTYAFGLYLFASVEPSIRSDIGFGQNTTGLLTAIGMAGFLLLSLLSGILRDRLGAAYLTLGTLAVCGLFLLWQANSDSVGELAVQRFVLGACTATIWAPMAEIIPRFVSKAYQGRILGLISSGTNFGLVMNGGLMVVVLEFGSWRELFLVTAGLAALLAVIWASTVVRWDQRYRAHEPTTELNPEITTRNQYIPDPVRPILALAALAAFTGMPATTFLAAFTIGDLGLSETVSAVAWTLMGLVGMVSGVAMGGISDWFGYRSAFSLAMVILMIGSATVVLAVPSAVSPLLIAGCLAIGFFPIYGLIPSFIAKTVSNRIATRTFGFVNVALGVSGMLGNAIAGYVREMTGDHATFFCVAGLFAAMGLAVALGLKEPGTAGSQSDGP